ncbi:MAG TPA: AAA family ATPase [Alloacidobacterium sp.]|nr:AAA family ATPase [Alloacidobacterium sp.]
MYRAYFNLTQNPFDLTPDPTFLFATKKHNEALSALYYGIRYRKGFVVVTGEVGTGKTLLLRCLLQLFQHSSDVTYAYIFNSLLSPSEFLQYAVADLGLQSSGKNKSELLLELSRFLISRNAEKHTSILIVDEAHHLSAEVLEEIRLLTNLETANEKLLQVVLLGQPELDEKLDSVGLRQLKQRIALRARLEPLSENEVGGYIRRRLQVAGNDQEFESLFPDQTITAIYRYSNGLPRIVNTLCEGALIHAYAKETRVITSYMVEAVARDLRMTGSNDMMLLMPHDDCEADSQRSTHALLELYSGDAANGMLEALQGE